MRCSAVTLLVLLWSVSLVLGGEKEPAAGRETGLVEAKVQGKLIRKDGRYCVQAKNPGPGDAFLVELVRTEDKRAHTEKVLKRCDVQAVDWAGLREREVG
jgi:hypothetical protein